MIRYTFIILVLLSSCSNPIQDEKDLDQIFDNEKIVEEFNSSQNEKRICDIEYDKILYKIDYKKETHPSLKYEIDSLKNIYPNKLVLWLELEGILELSFSNFIESERIFTEIIDMKIPYTIHIFALRSIARARIGKCEEAYEDIEVLKGTARYTEDSTIISKYCR